MGHADDLFYLFQNRDYSYGTWSAANTATSRRMCRLWANFARHLDPTPAGSDLGVSWSEVGQGGQYLNIGEDPAMEMDGDYGRRMKFWDETIIDTST